MTIYTQKKSMQKEHKALKTTQQYLRFKPDIV